MSSAGYRTGSPATSCIGAGSGTPPRIRQTSVLVPPMSNETASAIPARGGHRGRSAHTTGRAAQQQGDRNVGRHVDRYQPAGRRHHEDRVGHGRDAQEVRPAPGPQRGVRDGGHDPLVLPELGRDLVRAGHVEAPGPERVGDHLLVRRVEVGVEQAHRHRIDIVRYQRDARGVERLQLPTARVEAPADLEAQVTGNERLGPVDERVVERRARLARDLDHVGEAPRGDERDPATATLEQGVGRDRGAVREQLRAALTEPGDARSHRVTRVGRRRRGLHDPAVVGHDVGERPSGVHADPHRHQRVRECVHLAFRRPNRTGGASDSRPGRSRRAPRPSVSPSSFRPVGSVSSKRSTARASTVSSRAE